MESTKLAELLAAHYSLNRAQLELQQGLIDCQLAAMSAQVAVETTYLATIYYQQEQINLASSLSCAKGNALSNYLSQVHLTKG